MTQNDLLSFYQRQERLVSSMLAASQQINSALSQINLTDSLFACHEAATSVLQMVPTRNLYAAPEHYLGITAFTSAMKDANRFTATAASLLHHEGLIAALSSPAVRAAAEQAASLSSFVATLPTHLTVPQYELPKSQIFPHLPSDYLTECIQTAASETLDYVENTSDISEDRNFFANLLSASKAYIKENLLSILSVLICLFSAIQSSLPNEEIELIRKNQEAIRSQNEESIELAKYKNELLKDLNDNTKQAVKLLDALLIAIDAIEDEIEIHEDLTDLPCD